MTFGRCANLYALPLIYARKVTIPEQMVQINGCHGNLRHCAGAKEVMSYFIEALDRERVDALVTQTGCMGYCYAEPTVEITVPGKEPIVFGRVNKAKVDEIITCYIKQGILLDDIIPVNYNAVGPE